VHDLHSIFAAAHVGDAELELRDRALAVLDDHVAGGAALLPEVLAAARAIGAAGQPVLVALAHDAAVAAPLRREAASAIDEAAVKVAALAELALAGDEHAAAASAG
jgi:hypothetical protein